MNENVIEQFMAYRRKWLPHENDSSHSFARAVYLENSYWERMKFSVAHGINLYLE